MLSITRSVGPRPKLRVTSRRRTPACPHEAQRSLDEVDGNDDEPSGGTDFDNGFRCESMDCDAADDTFDFVGLAVALALDDFARKDDVFEIEDREVVIV